MCGVHKGTSIRTRAQEIYSFCLSGFSRTNIIKSQSNRANHITNSTAARIGEASQSMANISIILSIYELCRGRLGQFLSVTIHQTITAAITKAINEKAKHQGARLIIRTMESHITVIKLQ